MADIDNNNENQSHSDEDRLVKQVGRHLKEVHEKGLLEMENELVALLIHSQQNYLSCFLHHLIKYWVISLLDASPLRLSAYHYLDNRLDVNARQLSALDDSNANLVNEWRVMEKHHRIIYPTVAIQRTRTCISCGLLGKDLGWLLAPLLLFLSPPWVLLDGGERLGVWAAGDSWPGGPWGPTMTMECPSSAPWSSTGSSIIILSVSSSPKVSRDITLI